MVNLSSHVQHTETYLMNVSVKCFFGVDRPVAAFRASGDQWVGVVVGAEEAHASGSRMIWVCDVGAGHCLTRAGIKFVHVIIINKGNTERRWGGKMLLWCRSHIHLSAFLILLPWTRGWMLFPHITMQWWCNLVQLGSETMKYRHSWVLKLLKYGHSQRKRVRESELGNPSGVYHGKNLGWAVISVHGPCSWSANHFYDVNCHPYCYPVSLKEFTLWHLVKYFDFWYPREVISAASLLSSHWLQALLPVFRLQMLPPGLVSSSVASPLYHSPGWNSLFL